MTKRKVKGGKMAIRDVKNLLNASYKKKQNDVGDYIIDKDLSNRKVQVYKKKDDNQAVVVHRGTNNFSDWMTNLKMTLGYKNDDRFKNSKKIQKLAEQKYGSENISTLGHSLGSKLAEEVGNKSKEIITLNKPTLPLDLLTKKKVKDNQVDIRTKRDPVSILQQFQKGSEDIIIPSTTLNPLKEHTTNVLDRIDQDMVVGVGLNNIKLISIEPSNRKDKRLVALFSVNGLTKKVHFGVKNPKRGTYIDHKNKEIRKNYIARHSALEKPFLNNPLTASSLSMYVLWGPHTDLNKNIKYFKNKFNL